MQSDHPAAPDTRGVHLWLVLWRAYDALRAHAERNIAAQGLGFSDFAVLESLLHLGPLPVNTIGPKVRLTSGSITVAVDRLAGRGLVVRRGDPEDRRTRVVHLTRVGRTLAQRAFASHEAAMEEAAAALPAPKRRQLLRLLKQLGHAAAAQLPERDPL
jgi:MarR family transcriptional regulator, 2-MHQ and catechol-resistance regulon repressor